MKKNLFVFTAILAIFWVFSLVSNKYVVANPLQTKKAEAAMVQNITVSGTVLNYSSLTITSGGTIDFGNITPGQDSCNLSGTVLSVTTSAANGYTLGIHDGSDTDSAMSGATAKIPDMLGTIASPTQWATGSTTGLGVTLWTGTSALDSQWAVGSSPCDYADKYAGIPQNSTVARTKTDIAQVQIIPVGDGKLMF